MVVKKNFPSQKKTVQISSTAVFSLSTVLPWHDCYTEAKEQNSILLSLGPLVTRTSFRRTTSRRYGEILKSEFIDVINLLSEKGFGVVTEHIAGHRSTLVFVKNPSNRIENFEPQVSDVRTQFDLWICHCSLQQLEFRLILLIIIDSYRKVSFFDDTCFCNLWFFFDLSSCRSLLDLNLIIFEFNSNSQLYLF